MWIMWNQRIHGSWCCVISALQESLRRSSGQPLFVQPWGDWELLKLVMIHGFFRDPCSFLLHAVFSIKSGDMFFRIENIVQYQPWWFYCLSSKVRWCETPTHTQIPTCAIKPSSHLLHQEQFVWKHWLPHVCRVFQPQIHNWYIIPFMVKFSSQDLVVVIMCNHLLAQSHNTRTIQYFDIDVFSWFW